MEACRVGTVAFFVTLALGSMLLYKTDPAPARSPDGLPVANEKEAVPGIRRLPPVSRETDSPSADRQVAEVETLEQAWALALQVDQQLEAKKLELAASEQMMMSARAERRPVWDFDASYNFHDNERAFQFNSPVPGLGLPTNTIPYRQREEFSYWTTVTVPLYTSGRISHTIGAAEVDLTAAQHDVHLARMDLKLAVAEEYMAVLRAQGDVAVAENNVRSLAAHARDIETQYRQQRVGKNDLLAAQVSRDNAQLRVIHAHNAWDAARSAYNRRLRRPLNTPLRLTDPPIDEDVWDLETLSVGAQQNRPEIAQLALQIIAQRHYAVSLLAEKRPQVGMTGAYRFQENRFEMPQGIASLGVGVYWNLYDGGQQRHASNARRHQAEALIRRRTDLESRIMLDVRRAFLDVQEARQRLELVGRAIERANENLRVARKLYQFGRGTNTEVLDAEALRTESDRNHAHAHYDAILAHLRLRRAVGDL